MTSEDTNAQAKGIPLPMTADRDKAREIVREHRIKHGTMQRPDELADAIATAISAARAEERKRAAKVAERFYGGKAHTYASENADLYRAQDQACHDIATAIRTDGQADKGGGR